MPISPSLHDEVSKRLTQAREETLATVRARTDSDGDTPPPIAPDAHMAQGDDASEAEMTAHDEQHFADHETALLHEIDAAIGRLESGGYGICVSCGCEIPEERLLATPTVQTCIQCQERIEKEGHTGRGPTM
ncbi:TraR/DksA family transcriptional regulator [Massilia sp.]|uniref:TraR/DksA family transcriptional regulator n=1 Tax=Massilia sp. TaxID=1882437 RepID=UPI00289BCDB4|nr:TraR/DksA family transcriptional regulator [Massilia sp.]